MDRQPLSCVVVGDAAVTIRCVEMLRERGHRLLGVVTGDGRVAARCASLAAPLPCHFAPPPSGLAKSDVERLVGGLPFDLLFSIHNSRILPPRLLALPRRMAVNYHDALLPRYAGLHATTWAILHGETSHGITWHRMTAEVDAGEILLQRRVPIEPDDSAWTLSARCTEAALESFPELLAGLASGCLAGQAQEREDRSWFPGWRQPAPGCVIPWHAPAKSVSAFVRALDFGAADNPLAVPKLLAPGATLLVGRVEVIERRSGVAPGTVVTCGDGGLEIATATSDVRLSLVSAGLAAPAGKAIPLPEVTRHAPRWGLAPGVVLPSAAPEPERLAARQRSLRPHESYWTSLLANLAPLAPPGFQLGAGGEVPRAGRGATAAPDGGWRVDLEIPDNLLAGLPATLGDDACADEVMLAAVLGWLLLTVGQPLDVALGGPALRRELASRGWLGLLAARPPLRVERPEPATFRSLLQEIRERRRQHHARDTYALDLAARTRRLRGRFDLEPAVAVDLLDWREDLPGPPLGPGTTLAVTIAGGGRRLAWRCPHRISRDLLQAHAASFPPWLAGVVAAPDGELRAGSGRSARSTEEASSPGGSPPRTVSGLFREQAARAPAAPALEADGERCSYGELAQRSGRLAAALRRRGAGPDRLIALVLPGLRDLATGILGVLEAGAAVLVLDPAEPPARLARIIEEARPAFAVAAGGAASLRRLAPGLPIHPIALADAPEGPPAGSPAPARPGSRAGGETPAGAARAQGGDLVYVAFTSGSSGAPKGVAVEHRSLAHYIGAAGRRFGFGPGDRLLQIGSPAFDLFYEQLFGALCHGASLAALPGRRLLETRELLAVCARLGITVLDLPTAVWERAARDVAEQALTLPPTLRLVIIGGEQPRTASVSGWLHAAGAHRRLVNTYGPTEATIVATWWEAPRHALPPAAAEAVPIGTEVDGVEGHVLDPEGLPVAPGQAGELWLGGVGLARGYHRRPELTAARFVDMAAADGRRLYRTGDRVRRRPAGELEFLGRLDRQVKISGSRVEPAEVEAVLLQIPGVVEAAVAPLAVGSITAGRSHRLGAWVVLRHEDTPIAAIREEAARRLPAALRPTRIIALRSLPRSPSGKVDLRALRPRLAAAAALPAAAPDPPVGAVEVQLAAIWERVLGAGAVSRQEDFFDLGGDSLSALSLMIEIEQTFGRRLRLARLLRSPTVAALAEEILTAGGMDRASLLVKLQPEGEGPTLACVHGLGGHVLRLIPLARALAPDQPLIGLQSPGLDDEQPIPASIEELARLFLAEIRQASGSGPCYLCGMSFGGIVAFEMARQAAAAGCEVGLLALFDTDLAEILPDLRPAAPARAAALRGRVRRAIGDRLGRGRRHARRLLQGRDEIQRPNEYRNFTRVLRANELALGRYEPGLYAGKVTYFAATARHPAVFQEFVRRTGCDLEIVPVPGDHLGMLEPPHVDTLAAELRRRAGASRQSEAHGRRRGARLCYGDENDDAEEG